MSPFTGQANLAGGWLVVSGAPGAGPGSGAILGVAADTGFGGAETGAAAAATVAALARVGITSF